MAYDIKSKLSIQEITDFDLDYPRICIIGKRGSGESLVLDLLKRFNIADKTEDNLLIISPTDELNPLFSLKCPTCKMLYRYDKNILREYLDRIKNMRDMDEDDFDYFSACIIFNDCLADVEMWSREPEISELFHNAKYYHITFIVILSYPLGITLDLRTNIDYAFLMFDEVTHNQKKMFVYFGGMFSEFDVFKAIYRKLTEDSGSMVIKNYETSQDIFDRLFWFKNNRSLI